MIQLYSTKNKEKFFDLGDAVLMGLAPDKGLFMPDQIQPLEPKFIENLPNLSFVEIAFAVAQHLLRGAVPDALLKSMVEQAITFDAPLVPVTENIYALELFHGPTLSFKDFGARFMARLMAYFNRNSVQDLHILAATSGDTGSAVAQGFFNVPKTHVWILYPQQGISPLQEKQMTTLGGNVTALAVDGSFDDCQALVKQAFNDEDLRQQLLLSSANSINIARLIPQTFYYFYAYAQLKNPRLPVVVSVPSGNFGNITAGLIAKRMGLPIHQFIAATNSNNSVPRYLSSGLFEPKTTVKTISNAMDVGNPSNFDRILDLYQHDINKIRADIFGVSFSDAETEQAITDVYQQTGYLMDPHGAVGYLGLMQYCQQNTNPTIGIFLETAHPVKFRESVEPLIRKAIPIPVPLQTTLNKPSVTQALPVDYSALKNLLLG